MSKTGAASLKGFTDDECVSGNLQGRAVGARTEVRPRGFQLG